MILLFLIICFCLPYLLLLYEGVSVWVRLLFISLFEILGVIFLVIISRLCKTSDLLYTLFFFNMIIVFSVILKIALITIVWLVKKASKGK